jgi:soluble lytic murein transglycosylase-like protein
VQPGDSLWSIAAQADTDVATLCDLNGLAADETLLAGQQVVLPWRGSATPAGTIEDTLTQEARVAGVDPALVKAIAWQESSWRMVIAADGGIGVMQLMPQTADWVGSALLGRALDPYSVRDNIVGGITLLRYDLRLFHDTWTAVAAYHEGSTAVATAGVSLEGAAYADRVLALAQGSLPPRVGAP